MPEIETKNEWAQGLEGVHLFHANMSNCSQRVRVALEEKLVDWTGHHIDIVRDEHTTDHYQSINPNGVVPTLVHDGRTIIESVDILAYIDGLGDGPSLVPDDPALQVEMERLTDMAADIQGAVKTVSHEFLFKPVRKLNEKQLAKMRAQHRNSDLVNFLEEFSRGFSDDRLRAEVGQFVTAFTALEQSLQQHGGPWLLGDQLTLADIAWIVNVHRLDLMRFDYGKWPLLKGWLAHMKQRPSYQKGLAAWEPKGIMRAMAIYSRLRGLFGSGVNKYH